jgi:PhnB protein
MSEKVSGRLVENGRTHSLRLCTKGSLNRHDGKTTASKGTNMSTTMTAEMPHETTSASPAANRAFLVQPYLFFNGRCEEAVEFYQRALGAEVKMLARYKDSPEPPPPGRLPPGFDNKIMHAGFRIGGTTIMASDGSCEGEEKFGGFSLTLTVPDTAAADQAFAALADGGKVEMPLTKTFFSPRFGMVTDRFGVSWMIIVEHQ